MSVTYAGVSPTTAFRLAVNGQHHEVSAGGQTTLLSVLRQDLGLTGTKSGCGHGGCGACVVLIDGAPARACTTRLADAAGKQIVTIEGIGDRGALHRVQQAFLDEDALQCGYCTSGMILTAVALLDRSPHPDENEIRHALAGQLCRCGVYGRVVRAVLRAAS